MSRLYDSDGDPIEARDVLDEYELAQDEAAHRHDQPSFRRPRTTGLHVDELGYDRDGNWHPEHDGRW